MPPSGVLHASKWREETQPVGSYQVPSRPKAQKHLQKDAGVTHSKATKPCASNSTSRLILQAFPQLPVQILLPLSYFSKVFEASAATGKAVRLRSCEGEPTSPGSELFRAQTLLCAGGPPGSRAHPERPLSSSICGPLLPDLVLSEPSPRSRGSRKRCPPHGSPAGASRPRARRRSQSLPWQGGPAASPALAAPLGAATAQPRFENSAPLPSAPLRQRGAPLSDYARSAARPLATS